MNRFSFRSLSGFTSVAAVLLFICAAASAEQFKVAPQYAVDTHPLGIASADFNHDGHADLAVAIGGQQVGSGKELMILLANANGSFTGGQKITTSGTVSLIVAADFNHDGVPDLAAVSGPRSLSNIGVSVMLGNGDGTFKAPVSYAPLLAMNCLVSGDFDGDGLLDLVATNASRNFYFLKGKGDGTFQSGLEVLTTGIFYSDLITADFNHDGKLDVAVADDMKTDGSITIYLGHGDGTFQAGTRFRAGSHPHALAVGDFNNDGKADLAVTQCELAGSFCGDQNDVAILLGKGDGTLQPQHVIMKAVGAAPEQIRSTDMNGDGNADLVVVDSGSDDVVILLGNGNGTFRRDQRWSAGQLPRGFAIGDFNGDGVPDIATANNKSSTVTALLGTSKGNLAAARDYAMGDAGLGVITADFDGDGAADIATCDSKGNVNILLGQGSGTFSPPIVYPTGLVFFKSFLVGDLNGDHHPDLVAVNEIAFTVLLNNGNGTFSVGGTFTAANDSLSGVLGDFNGDGELDVLVGNNHGFPNAGSLSLFLGNGNGTFQPESVLSIGNNLLTTITAGDFNNDGKLDAAVVSSDGIGATVFVMRGNGDGTFQAPSPATAVGPFGFVLAAADLNGDGKLDLVVTEDIVRSNNLNVLLGNGDGTLQPVVNYMAGKIAEGVAFADFDGDGKLDVAVANADGVLVLLRGAGGGNLVNGPRARQRVLVHFSLLWPISTVMATLTQWWAMPAATSRYC